MLINMLFHTTMLAKLPAVMLLTLLLSSVQIRAGVIKKRETFATLHSVESVADSTMGNTDANVGKSAANSLNPALSTRLLPEKSGSLVMNKVEKEALRIPSEYENLENKVAIEESKTVVYDVDNKEKVTAETKEDAAFLKGTSIIETLTKPPNEISKNSNTPLEAQEVSTESLASKSQEFGKNEVFSNVNPQSTAKIEFTSNNKISDGLDQQALNMNTKPSTIADTLENERVSNVMTKALPTSETIPSMTVVPATSKSFKPQTENVKTDSMLHSEELDDFETTTIRLEPIAVKLQTATQATIKSPTNELQTNELFKSNNVAAETATTVSTLTLPDVKASTDTTLAPIHSIDSNELGATSTKQRAPSSGEKRAKFINDNSTNTNKLQLPDAAEVWTLAGMKSVGMHHASKPNVSTTERAPNESSNSEKNLLDWTHIMNNKQDEKTFDNLIDSSTPANKVAEISNDIPRNTTVEITYMPAATMAIETKTELTNNMTQIVNETATIENVTVFSNVDANTVLNIELLTTTQTAAANNDFVNNATTADALSTTPTATLSIDKSLDNKETFLPSEKSNVALTERIVVNQTTESTFVHSANEQTFSPNELEATATATSTTKSIPDLAELKTTTLPTYTVEADKPGVTEQFTTTETLSLPDKHFSTSVQPPPATSAGSVETNSTSYLNEHANVSVNDTNNNNNGNNNTNAFNTALEHNSSDTTTFSTPIASVVNTTVAIDQNTTVSNGEDEFAATTLEKISTTAAPTTTTTTTDSELLATILGTVNTKPITSTTTEANNQNGNEVELDIGTEQIDTTSSTTIATITTTAETKADETTTTSSDKNLLINTTTRTTLTTTATPNQALPTLATESVSAVTETDEEQHEVITTHAVPNTTTTATTSIEDNIGLEKPNETESSIETNAIDSSEKTKTTDDKATQTKATTNTTSSVNEDEHNEDMLLPDQQGITSTTPIIIPTFTIPTNTTPSNTTPSITSTTTEAPLISLLDDFLTSTTTVTPPPVGLTTEKSDMYSVYSTTTTTTEGTIVNDTAATTILPSINTMVPTLTSLIPKLIESSTSPAATTTLRNVSNNILYGSPLSNNNSKDSAADAPETDVNVIIAISVSCIGIVALVLLVAFLYVMRKRQKQMSYGQRCRPVSLDAYSMDNVSVFNSVRRKGAPRSSKRSYGNVAFDDPSLKHHLLGATDLSKFVERRISIFEEFRDVPQITARANEVPSGCEDKNRYANVIPLPETRVILQQQNDDEKTEYINANYVRGPKDTPNYYIACQAPLDSTVTDFWRMIWEQQSRVIIQATDLIENGIEKCAEYLPPSVTIDNHVTYGDYQIMLKNREVKDKYAISTLMLKNIAENTSRELTHYWYKWPEAGVPQEEAPIIAMLLEARSSLKSYAIEQANELKEKSSTLTIKSDAANSTGKEMTLSVSSLEKSDEQKDTGSASGSQNGEINGNVSTDKLKAAARNQGPLTVHCSPGTGRTGTIIGCDIAIRCLETPKRIVDIPQIVYYVRRGRASAVQTKEQYEFIYKVANMYATKITNLSNDN